MNATARVSKRVALVTGANQGIGRQIATDLLAHDYAVLVGSRDLERGQAAAGQLGPNAHALQLDVTVPESIRQAATTIGEEFGRLDVLVQNAAIMTTTQHPGSALEYARLTRPSTVSLDEMRAVWETNVFGVMAVYQAMVPLLRTTPGACIVNVSSGAGSLTVASDPALGFREQFSPVYSASKTALNALTLAMAIELEEDGIPVNAVSPGFTKTAMNAFEGTDTVEEGASEAVRLALLGGDAPTGTFTHATFGALPW